MGEPWHPSNSPFASCCPSVRPDILTGLGGSAHREYLAWSPLPASPRWRPLPVHPGIAGKPSAALPAAHAAAEGSALHLRRAEANGGRKGPRLSRTRVGHGAECTGPLAGRRPPGPCLTTRPALPGRGHPTAGGRAGNGHSALSPRRPQKQEELGALGKPRLTGNGLHTESLSPAPS